MIRVDHVFEKVVIYVPVLFLRRPIKVELSIEDTELLIEDLVLWLQSAKREQTNHVGKQ